MHSQESGPRKVVRFGPWFGPRNAVPFGSRIWAPKSRIPFGPRKNGWWTQMCRLKRWPPKSPWRNIHSEEPRARKSCSIRAPIRPPKSCSIRVPDSGPEKFGPRFGPRKVVYHSGPGFGPRKAVPFGPRVQALNCFQAGNTIRVGSEDLFKIWAGFRPRSCHRGSKGQWRNGSAPELTCGPAVGREVADSNPACPHLLRRVTLGGLQQFNCRKELWRLWQAWLAL